MFDYIVVRLQEKRFLLIAVAENQVYLFDDGKTVSVITSVNGADGTCNETMLMLEILKKFQNVKHVSVIATKCNWFRIWVIWKIFSDYEIDLSGLVVKRNCRYYVMQSLKTACAVLFGICYRTVFYQGRKFKPYL